MQFLPYNSKRFFSTPLLLPVIPFRKATAGLGVRGGSRNIDWVTVEKPAIPGEKEDV